MAATIPAPTDAELDRLADAALRLQAAGEFDSWLSGLEPGDVAIVEQALARRTATGWRATPATMAHRLDPIVNGQPSFQLYPYVELLGRKFVQLVDGTDPYQIWNLPPQYGKSTLVNRGLAWALDRHPEQRFVTTSYGDELADRNALDVRDFLEGHADVLNPAARLRRDARRKDRFRTAAGGGLAAAGIGSAITGFPAHGVVIDDPFKNWQEAHSAARRELVWNQYLSVLWQRRTSDDAWVLIVMTRWHEDDLAARLQQKGRDDLGVQFTTTRLAELAEAADQESTDPVLRQPDPLGRAPGETLEPRRFSQRSAEVKRKVLGSYLWSGMNQQRPSPAEGTEILREWWRLGEVAPTEADEWLTSWDMKLKDSESGDYVVGGVWARLGSSYWLVDVLRGQWNQPTTANAIALAHVRWPNAARHLVENTGNGPEVMKGLRKAEPDYQVSDAVAETLAMTAGEREAVTALRQRGIPGLTPINPKGDKSVRMRAVTPYIETGHVWLPKHAPWLGELLEETAAFPNGAHDDQVDMISQALARLALPAAQVEQPQTGAPVPQRTVRQPQRRQRMRR